MKEHYKTTKKDFVLFKQEVRKWIDILGLKSWDLDIVHKNNGDMPSAVGWCRFNLIGRCATIGLAEKWELEITDKSIRKTAFHEVSELLTARLNVVASERCITQAEIEESVHELIRTLENVLWVKY